MWHEARKQERMIRGMMVDYRRRAERRKDFYEKIKADPTQFLQLHGRPCRIHLDPAIAAAGDSPAIMMPWQGDSAHLIDRFDVRAHLDQLPNTRAVTAPTSPQLSAEERQINYERYRILAQNTFLGISEDKFLQQLAIEEQFGVTIEEKEAQKGKLNDKKSGGAAIAYNYSEPAATPVQPPAPAGPEAKADEESEDDSDLEIIDVDLSIDVTKVEPAQAHELNLVGPQYGLAGCDLFSFLTGDADDAELERQRVRDEKEKAMFSGRKSRRERRAHRDKKLALRVLSPPSYALPAAGAGAARAQSRSPSRSRSPSPAGGPAPVQFITSFGADDEPPRPAPSSGAKGNLYADKVRQNLANVDVSYSAAVRGQLRPGRRSPAGSGPRSLGPHRPGSRSTSRSDYTSRSRSRSRSRSYSPRYRSRTRSRSRGRARSPLNNYARGSSRSMSAESARGAGGGAAGSGVAATPAPVPRYYGRRKSLDKSSSELTVDSDSSDTDANDKSAVGVKPNTGQNQLRLTGSSSKSSSRREGVSLKEKLRRKMQAQLSRQLRADKMAAEQRRERETALQAQRDDEMRELAIRMRRRHRVERHRGQHSSGSQSDEPSYSSPARESPERDDTKKRSRSKSSSPESNNGGPTRMSQAGTSNSYKGRSAGPSRAAPSNEPDRNHRSSHDTTDYDGGYDQQEDGYSQGYYNNDGRSYNTYNQRSYATRRPYGQGYGRHGNTEQELQYDESWEHEFPEYRGRGRGYSRRPYYPRGSQRRHYDNPREDRGSEGYQERDYGGQGYQDGGRYYEDRQQAGYEQEGRGYEGGRGRRAERPAKSRKLVDY